MGLSRWNRVIAVLALIFAVIYGWTRLFDARRPPCYSIDVKYFGASTPASTETEDFSIRPFKVPFDRSQVDDVIHRLRQTRFSEPQILVDHKQTNRSSYGFNRQTAESVREYFINTFDWKKTVHELNELNHFKTNIAVRDRHCLRRCFSSGDFCLCLRVWIFISSGSPVKH